MVIPPMRCRMCLPTDTTSSTVWPLRSTVAKAGTRRSHTSSTCPASASFSARAER